MSKDNGGDRGGHFRRRGVVWSRGWSGAEMMMDRVTVAGAEDRLGVTRVPRASASKAAA